jgi:hypothetical protein
METKLNSDQIFADLHFRLNLLSFNGIYTNEIQLIRTFFFQIQT